MTRDERREYIRDYRIKNGQQPRVAAAAEATCKQCGKTFPIDRETRKRRFCCLECKLAAYIPTRGNLKHGLATIHRHPLYQTWCGMRARCNNPASKSYTNYGARGVTVCAKWADFAAFVEDMGLRPTPKHTIERRDNSKGYEPGNCHWATRTEQARNMRKNRSLTYQGETLLLEDWARRFNVYSSTLHSRLERGMPIGDALNKEPRKRPSKTRTR